MDQLGESIIILLLIGLKLLIYMGLVNLLISFVGQLKI